MRKVKSALKIGFDAEEQAAAEAVVLAEKYRRAVDAVGCQDGAGGFGIRRTRRVERGDLRERRGLSGDAPDLVAQFRIRPGVAVALIEIVEAFDEKFPHQKGLKCGVLDRENLEPSCRPSTGVRSRPVAGVGRRKNCFAGLSLGVQQQGADGDGFRVGLQMRHAAMEWWWARLPLRAS